MSEHPDEWRFYKFLDGEMTPDEEQVFREHVEDCERCTDRLEQLREEEQQLSEAMTETPETGSIADDVMDEIGQSELQESSSVIGFPGSVMGSRTMKIAASLILLLGVGVAVYNQFGLRQMSQTGVGEGQQAMDESVHEPTVRKLTEKERKEKAQTSQEKGQAGEGQAKPSANKRKATGLADASKADKTRSSEDDAEVRADKQTGATHYDVKHRDPTLLLGSVKDQFSDVDFSRKENRIEFTSIDTDVSDRVLAFLDRHDTVPPTPKTAGEQLRIATRLESDARGASVESEPANAVPQTQDELMATQDRSSQSDRQSQYMTSKKTMPDAEWSQDKLEEANEKYKNVKQLPSASKKLSSRASIHLAMNYFRMDQSERAMTEYEFWKRNFGESEELPSEERTLLNRVKKQYHSYRLRKEGWSPMNEGTWEFTHNGNLRARPKNRQRSDRDRVLVNRKSLSDTTYEVEVSVKPTGGRGDAGLVFGIEGNPETNNIKKYYAYTYEPVTERVSLTRANPSTNERETLWTQSRTAMKSEWVTLGVEVNGRKVSLYLNDTIMNAVTLDQYPSASSGLIHGQTQVGFKDFSVK